MEDSLARAKERVRVGPVPDWVIPCPFDAGFAKRPDDRVTHLLFSQQAHAERHQTHFHMALRLETVAAVQQLSQWRLHFDPSSQGVTVHSIKIHRSDGGIEHAAPGKFRVMQREQGWEEFAIHGLFTLLLLLEDVRAGDILETSYTIENRSAILPDYCLHFFAFPEGTPIGKYHISAQFSAARPMRWKSSSPELAPAENRAEDAALWVWSGANHVPAPPEPNSPAWHVADPWIQISDCPDWGTAARAFAGAWREEDDDPALAEIVKEITTAEPNLLRRVERAIRLLQDDYRYLSVGMELGGQVPAPAGTVIRRRFGDGKDLSFLLVLMLRRLGVSARPVLVNALWRKSVADLLPTDGCFNHVIVEFEAQGELRWVDATIKNQGGGVLNRAITDYGAGLPVDAAAVDLVKPPRNAADAGVYQLKETILLDTTGKASLLGAVLLAKGVQAEVLRKQFEANGVEKVAVDRLQDCANRFGHARRVGQLEHRDDREANEFSIAEVFEINGFLIPHQDPALCQAPLPKNLVVASLPLPEVRARQAPFALPHPCSIVHTIELQSQGLRQTVAASRQVDTSLLRFDREMKSGNGYWAITLKLSTLTDAVMPDLIAKHRKTVEEIRSASTCALIVPVGHPHPRMRSNFGKLPHLARESSRRAIIPPLEPLVPAVPKSAAVGKSTGIPTLSTADLPDPAALPATAMAAATNPLPAQSANSGAESERKHRRRRKRTSDETRPQSAAAVIGIVAGVVLGIILYILLVH